MIVTIKQRIKGMGFMFAALLVLLGDMFWQGWKKHEKENSTPKRDFPETHSTNQDENVYVDGVGWCKRKD